MLEAETALESGAGSVAMQATLIRISVLLCDGDGEKSHRHGLARRLGAYCQTRALPLEYGRFFAIFAY